jgi:RNA recognition motif-containing protein
MDDEPKSNTIFIANLNPNITKDDVKAVFRRFGKIVSIDLIRKRPENVYAFIEFDDMRDAVDAVM